jgi:hypothetical protein
MAGSYQSVGSFEFDNTDPARPGWDKVPVMAERWNIDPGFFSRLKNRQSRMGFDIGIVYLDF